MVQEEGLSLSEKLDKTLNLLEGEKKPKKVSKDEFKLPFGVSFGAKSKVKKNHVIVQTIDDNGSINFRLLPIENNMIHLKDKGTYHLATADYMLRYKQYPFLIQPTFDSEPYNIRDRFNEADKEGRLTTWQKYYINVMNLSMLKPKMQMSGKIIFLIIIGAIIAIGFIMSRV